MMIVRYERTRRSASVTPATDGQTWIGARIDRLARRFGSSVVLIALLTTTAACSGPSGDSGENSTARPDEPAVPVAVPLPEESWSSSADPTPEDPSTVEAEIWILPTEGDRWISTVSEAPGVYRYENADIGCYATYTETPLEDLNAGWNSPSDSLDTSIETAEDAFDWVEPLDVEPFQFADPEAPLTFETIGITYPSHSGEDYVLVTSSHWTDTHEVTAALACPLAEWNDGAETTAVDFLERARFDPSFR